MGNVYQCCYTNTTHEVGSIVKSGWQAVAVSPDLPPEADKTCTQLQNLNATIPTRMLDEQGQVLNLYEITGDGNYIYMMRTQYGLADPAGRPSMFSHAYIFPLDDSEVFSDPNLLLSIDKSNFKTDEAEASAWNGQFVRRDPLTLDSALQISGMDRERYAALVRCVYAQMSERKSPRPLYIQYNGSEDQLQAILYCIYYGIPYYMRKRLSMASCPAVNDRKKNLIFSCDAKSKDRFFLPQTGENNILDNRTQRKIDRYGYIDYAAKHLSASEFLTFFETLDQLVITLGDSTASNELVLKVAYQCYNHIEVNASGIRTVNFSSFSDEELDVCLSDALRTGLFNSVFMGLQVAYLLSVFSHRGLDLSEANEETLDEWIASSDCERLRQEGLKYRVQKLRVLPPEKAVDQLLDMPNETFKLYSAELLTSSDGEELMDLYFAKLSSRDLSWDQLNDLWEMSGIMASRSKTTDAVQTAAWNRYCEDIAEGGEMQSYEKYSQFMKTILCPGPLMENRQYYECMVSAKEEFWQYQQLTSFSYGRKGLYQFMSSTGVPVCGQFMELINLIEDFDPSNPGKYLNTVFQFFSSHQNSFSETAKEHVIKELTGCLLGRCDESYIDWVRVFADGAKYMDKDSSELLICIRALYNNTVQFNAHELIWNLKSFLILEQRDAIKNRVYSMVETTCIASDTSLDPIPLDLWLLLGEQYQNCFDIIGQRRPKIIGADPTMVVRNSELLKNPEYQDAAQQYIKKSDGKSSETKAVKCWLNECRQAEKSKRSEGWPFSSKRVKGDSAPRSDDPWPVPEAQGSGDQSVSESKPKGKGLRGLFGKK